MIEETIKNRTRFEKQRRNLILVSIILAAYICLGVELKKVSILGNTFDINNTENIETFIWVLFAYLLIRYYQFYRIINNSDFLTVINTSMQKYVPLVALSNFRKQDIKRVKEEHPDGFNFKYNIKQHEVYTTYPWLWSLKISGHINWEQEHGGGTQQFNEVEFTISGKQLLWSKFKAYFNAYFHTPYITEYLLPFMVAIATILIKLNM